MTSQSFEKLEETMSSAVHKAAHFMTFQKLTIILSWTTTSIFVIAELLRILNLVMLEYFFAILRELNSLSEKV